MSGFLSAFKCNAEHAESIVPADPDPLVPCSSLAQNDLQTRTTLKPLVVANDTKSKFKSISQAGKVGSGRHGDVFERRLLTSHMRSEKARRQTASVSEAFLNLLERLKPRVSNDQNRFKVTLASGRLAVKLGVSSKATKGNRYQTVLPLSHFLAVGFSRARKDNILAASLGVAKSTIPYMRVLCSNSVMRKQAIALASLANASRKGGSMCCISRLAFDEAGQFVKLKHIWKW